jgi:hypothetical protein
MTARTLVVLAVCALLTASRGDGAPGGACTLELVSGGRLAWSTRVWRGEAFAVSFEHSAERCRWTQHYRVSAGGGIEQVSSTFPCIGAGMPWSSTDGSPAIRTREGYTLAAIRALQDIHMRNSLRARIRLVVGDQRVDVSGLFDDFQPFTLRLR